MKSRNPMYGLLAEFADPESLKRCIRSARQEGFKHIDAYTPFPVEGVGEELGTAHSAVPLIVLIGGIAGGLIGALMQWYSSVYDYPLNIGGRPFNSWPSFVVIVFELTVLVGGLSGLFGMLALNGLPKPHHPLFSEPRFDRATQDRFFFCIEAEDPKFDAEETWKFLEELRPEGLYAVQDEP